MARPFVRAALFATAALIAAPALAQETPPQASSEDNAEAAVTTDPADIVVTARRRSESLLNVPIAVTAFTGAQLEASERKLVAYAGREQIINVPTTRDGDNTAASGTAGTSLAGSDLAATSQALVAARASRAEAEGRWNAARGAGGLSGRAR